MDYKAILEKNKDNTELLKYLAQEVNSWDGSLEYLQVYEFDEEFFDTYFEDKPMEAVRATFFGQINNWMDEYIRFNGYGNLESLTDYEFEKELQESADEIIEYALNVADNIDIAWGIEQYTDNEEEEA